MIIAVYNFHPKIDDKKHPILNGINFIQKLMTRNIQHWMIITAYNFHPNIDDKKHPILDDNLRHNFHPKTDDKKHPILEMGLNKHPNMDDFIWKFSSILDFDYT